MVDIDVCCKHKYYLDKFLNGYSAQYPHGKSRYKFPFRILETPYVFLSWKQECKISRESGICGYGRIVNISVFIS